MSAYTAPRPHKPTHVVPPLCALLVDGRAPGELLAGLLDDWDLCVAARGRVGGRGGGESSSGISISINILRPSEPIKPISPFRGPPTSLSPSSFCSSSALPLPASQISDLTCVGVRAGKRGRSIVRTYMTSGRDALPASTDLEQDDVYEGHLVDLTRGVRMRIRLFFLGGYNTVSWARRVSSNANVNVNQHLRLPSAKWSRAQQHTGRKAAPSAEPSGEGGVCPGWTPTPPRVRPLLLRSLVDTAARPRR